MYKQNKHQQTTLKVNKAYQGETIEMKINRILNNKEPITDGAPLIYTERRDGVNPAYDIRTDRWEIAVDAMDKVNKSKQAQREQRLKLGDQAKEGMKKEGETPTGEQNKN